MKRHTLRITDEHWERAKAVGQAQTIRLSPSQILTHALNIFFEQINQQSAAESESATTRNDKSTS